MKPTLLFTALTTILATSTTFAKSELETLRALCAEQERQIRHLEDENMKLRDGREVPAPKIQSDVKSTPSSAVSTTAKTEVSETIYVVKSGDSIEKIARKVGTSATQLSRANGLKSAAIIRPGQKLKVPGTGVAASTPDPAATTPVRNTGGKSHTVRQGETFFSIAKKHGISTANLVAANPTVKASALRPGQVLRLGGSGPSTALISAPASQIKAAPAVEKAPAPIAKSREATPSTPAVPPAPTAQASIQEPQPAPAVEQEAPSTPPEKKFRAITIDGEMTYGEFATKHGTDAERLNALNGLDLTTATVLAKGSELYVPAQP